MRKLFEITLILVMLFALVACKTTETLDANEPAQQPEVASVAEPEPVAAAPEPEPEQKGLPVFDPLKGVLPGVLYQLNPVEGQEPVVRAVSLSGNRAVDEINKREPSIDNIRFVFELNEWIGITADSDKT
ncbi:MAG: hypothetical protein II962_00780, partial [Spirochaetales bacterium]|nr:hypothetical protein [Spirochaetales bacterium]